MLPHEHTRHTRHAQRSKCLTKRSCIPLQNDVHDICLSSRQRVPPLRYSALRPAATIKVEAVKCCWEMIVRCCRLHRVQLWLVVPWQMGVRHGVVLQRKCGSAVLACAAQQSLWHCMEACHALGCLGSARRERRMTDESAVTHRGKIMPKARLAIRTKRTSKIKVSHREKPKTGQLVFIC